MFKKNRAMRLEGLARTEIGLGHYVNNITHRNAKKIRIVAISGAFFKCKSTNASASLQNKHTGICSKFVKI